MGGRGNRRSVISCGFTGMTDALYYPIPNPQILHVKGGMHIFIETRCVEELYITVYKISHA